MDPSPANPYEPPACVEANSAVDEIRRPPIGTFLVVLWTVEALFKTSVVIVAILRGFNPLHFADGYRTENRLFFFLIGSFMTIETIGPWIGIYYLTGRRARTIPFEKALLRTLKLAVAIALVIVILLMIYCEIQVRMP